MHPVRLLAGLLALALLGPPALVLAAPAAAAATSYPTTVEIQVSHVRQVYGRPITVRGRVLATVDGTLQYFWGQTLTLERSLAGAAYADVGTATTPEDDGGWATFSTLARANARYRLRFDGAVWSDTVTLEPGTSASRAVQVTRRLQDRSTRIGRLRFRFHGRVLPAYPRKRVYLQRKGCGACAWKGHGSVLTSRRSAWSFVVRGRPRAGARVWYRAYVPASSSYALSWSRTLRITTLS